MKRILLSVSIVVLLLVSLTSFALAGDAQQEKIPLYNDAPEEAEIIAGALLYDNWFAYLGVAAPDGNMPIWARQTTNTRSGPVTWRCVECHGWDYRGAQGAYGSGSHYTGFPGVKLLAARLSADQIVGHLQGEKITAHDFSPYLDETSMRQLAAFLQYGMINEDQYIDPVSLQVKGGDLATGQQFYAAACAECHGEDGAAIIFRTEGVNESLGAVANRDPWRFLHRTRFGNAGTGMPVGHSIGWTINDGRDVLAYAQTLPTGFELQTAVPIEHPPIEEEKQPAWIAGIFTSLGIFMIGILVASGFFLMFTVLGILAVNFARKRREK